MKSSSERRAGILVRTVSALCYIKKVNTNIHFLVTYKAWLDDYCSSVEKWRYGDHSRLKEHLEDIFEQNLDKKVSKMQRYPNKEKSISCGMVHQNGCLSILSAEVNFSGKHTHTL